MARGPVVVEREWPGAVSLEAVAEQDRRARWCMSANDAHAVLHAVAPGAHQSICIYDAPDVEALRRVADTLHIEPPPSLWASTEHWNPAGERPALALKAEEQTIGMVHRCFDRPTAFAEAQSIEAASSHCLTINGVRFLRSYLARDLRTMLCLYAAPDLEAIRAANRLIGLPMSGVLNVMVRTPD